MKPEWIYTGIAVATGLLALATILGRLGRFFFLFELCSHFSVQFAVIAAGLTVVWTIRRRWLLTGIAALCLAWHSYLVLPWLLASPPSVSDAKAGVRILHANVLYTRDEMQTTIDLIRREKPDLFVLQEMTPESIKQVTKALADTYPYTDTLMAKDPCYLLVASRTSFLTDHQARRDKLVFHLMTNIRDHDLSFITVHTRTPILPSWFDERNEQLAFVSERIQEVPQPAVLMGDFNVSIFSPVYAQYFDDRPGLTACRKGFGIQPTWPRYLLPLMLPIDQAFVNSGFRTVNFRTLPQPGSDHKAVVVDLAFTKQN
ncbi:hypothetical protein BLX24_07080 [Arsenicibacter rosenii]|uniref:Endonuclease/exonuclease/phosphatase domain-containing protein n=2 Tax=Arsenicibacter rosenii TaxID=1750698 RepID=A0A1S2VMK9_9BACT|nr:hypothetical protein BLX24_07080 [Arsenicibacter rosenii]